MLDLALHADGAQVSLADISRHQGISLSYLEPLFANLRPNNLVSSVRGPGGGLRLVRRASETAVAWLVDAVNESLDTTRCKRRGDCQNGDKCLTHDLWSDLSDRIHDFLSSITLAELMSKREVRSVAERQQSRLQEVKLPVKTA